MILAFGLIVPYLFFMAIGSGLTRILASKLAHGYPWQLCLSGIIGFVFISVLHPILIMGGISFSFYGWLAIAIASAAFSISSFFLVSYSSSRSIPLGHSIDQNKCTNANSILPLSATILTISALALAALLAGGLTFHILRGNGTDAFNYATIGTALQRFSLSEIQNTDVGILVSRDPINGLAKALLLGRWATGALLGWCGMVSGTAPVQITFAFGYLCLILSAGPCFLIARYLGCSPWSAAAITVAILVGFWGQAVLDMQALSQLHAFPLALFIIFLIIQTQDQSWKSWIGNGRLLLTLATTGLTLAYIEYLPFLILGLGLYFFTMYAWKYNRLQQIFLASLPIACGIFIAFLLIPDLFDFLKNQILFPATATINWHQAYFRWLYKDPLAGIWGIWGLTHIDGGFLKAHGWRIKTIGDIIKSLPCLFLITASIAFMGTIRYYGAQNPMRRLIAALLIAGLVQTIFLLLRQQWWAAGKAISFFMPFLWLGTGWVLFNRQILPEFMRKPFIAPYIRGAAILWVVSQLWLGLMRVGIATAGSDYRGYMTHHAVYRQYDWDLQPIDQELKKAYPGPISIITENLWLGEYLMLSLERPLRFASKLNDRAGNSLLSKADDFEYPYLLVDRLLYPGISNFGDSRVIAKTKSLILLDLNWDKSSSPSLLAISNPNGLEWSQDGKPFIWIGGQETTLWIASWAEGTAFLSGQWIPGPSLLETSDRTLEAFGPNNFSAKFLIQSATVGLPIPLHRGINAFRLRAAEKPTITSLPGGDTRPLIIGLWNPHVSGWKQ